MIYIDPTAKVHPCVKLCGENIHIGPHCEVGVPPTVNGVVMDKHGGVVIYDNVKLFGYSVIEASELLSENTILHEGVTLEIHSIVQHNAEISEGKRVDAFDVVEPHGYR